jgi:release factor glutamine methyltransferase
MGALDLIVSNPPYVEPGEYGSLPREVRADPVDALVGGATFYGRLFAQASDRLRASSSVVVEIGERQAEAVSAAALAAGAARVSVRRDLTGRDRVVVSTWP